MPTARASRTIAAPLQELWELVSDPHHLPRWWPRVTRVEDVHEGAFTEVMRTKKGKVVRADFDIVRADEAEHVLTWAQRTRGTPFERVLRSAETELELEPASSPGLREAASALGTPGAPVDRGATRVTIELRQQLGGRSPHSGLYPYLPRLGSPMIRRAAQKTVERALEALERISV